jgi:hypothetical protein
MAAGFQAGRRDADKILALLNNRAELAQLGCHRRDAIGLLDPPASDVAQCGRTLGKQAPSLPASLLHQEYGCNRGRPQPDRLPAHVPPSSSAPSLCMAPIFGQRLGKFDVALNRILPNTFNANRTATNRPQSEKIGS